MKAFYDIMLNAEIVMPFYEVALMLVILTICFMIHSYKFGLLASFIFVFRLGWLFFRTNLGVDHFGYIIAYCAFGLVVFFIACYQFFIGES